MADSSSDLELLQDFEELSSSDDDSFEDLTIKQKRPRLKYESDRTFETSDEFFEWWNNDGSTGWEKDRSYTAKSGLETIYYR